MQVIRVELRDYKKPREENLIGYFEMFFHPEVSRYPIPLAWLKQCEDPTLSFKILKKPTIKEDVGKLITANSIPKPYLLNYLEEIEKRDN